MKPEDIKVLDWGRMLIGEVPPAFLLEVVFRIAFMYVLLMVAMRVLGKRMAGQMSRNEMAALVSLAAATGVSIIAPDRGILPPVVIAVLVVIISRVIALMGARQQKFEMISQGEIHTLVDDGVMNPKLMVKTRITKDRLMAELRGKSLKHLGQVKRMYFEANGIFSIVEKQKPSPGLSVIPPDDKDFYNEQEQLGSMVCQSCGAPNPSNNTDIECPNCHSKGWTVL